MDFDERCEAWYAALTDEQRAEAHATVGALPRWMVNTLEAVGIQAIPVEMTDSEGRAGHLMPTRLLDFLHPAGEQTR